MSMGPLNSLAGAAGSHLAQTRGTDTDRASDDRQQVNAQDRIDTRSSSIDENHETSDRDADGRDLTSREKDEEEEKDAQENTDTTEAQASEPPRSRDATGALGNHLDLNG